MIYNKGLNGTGVKIKYLFVFKYNFFLFELEIIFVLDIWSVFETICKYNQTHKKCNQQKAKHCLT